MRVAPAVGYDAPSGGTHFLGARGQEPIAGVPVGDLVAHPGTFTPPSSTPSRGIGAIPTAAPKANLRIPVARLSPRRLAVENGISDFQAGDLVFVKKSPPFMTNRLTKYAEATTLQRMNQRLATAELDLSDKKTRERVKALRQAYYLGEVAHHRDDFALLEARQKAGELYHYTPTEADMARFRASELQLARALAFDVNDTSAALDDYDLSVDYMALGLLDEWKLDGILIGSNDERSNVYDEADLLNVAVAGPTAMRNSIGTKEFDTKKTYQIADATPQSLDDVVLLLVATPKKEKGTNKVTFTFQWKLTTKRQVMVDPIGSSSRLDIQTVTSDDLFRTCAVVRVGQIMDAKLSNNAMLINVLNEWHPPSWVLAMGDQLSAETVSFLQVVKGVYKLPSLTAAFDKLEGILKKSESSRTEEDKDLLEGAKMFLGESDARVLEAINVRALILTDQAKLAEAVAKLEAQTKKLRESLKKHEAELRRLLSPQQAQRDWLETLEELVDDDGFQLVESDEGRPVLTKKAQTAPAAITLETNAAFRKAVAANPKLAPLRKELEQLRALRAAVVEAHARPDLSAVQRRIVGTHVPFAARRALAARASSVLKRPADPPAPAPKRARK